jgi:hypothetical protein
MTEVGRSGSCAAGEKRDPKGGMQTFAAFSLKVCFQDEDFICLQSSDDQWHT